MEHGVMFPFCLQRVNFQSLEQFLSALEVTLQGREKERLTETARAAEIVV
jgi:hypothetical protein